jgi:hypothetical protein
VAATPLADFPAHGRVFPRPPDDASALARKTHLKTRESPGIALALVTGIGLVSPIAHRPDETLRAIGPEHQQEVALMMRQFAVSAFVLSACVALAGQSPTSAPRSYDPAKEVTLGGIVTAVVATNSPDGTVGVHMDLQTAKNVSVRVHLGPAMFIGMNDASFFADDQVLITGAFVTHDGEVGLWARTVTKDRKTLALRNPDGTPRWSAVTADDPDGCGIPHAPVRY